MATPQLVKIEDHPQLKPFVLNNVQFTDRVIDRGAYGTVKEVILSGTRCAAKCIHQDLVHRDNNEEALRNVTLKFVEECVRMSTLCHPHIVQFLGIYCHDSHPLPYLVMELMNSSLHKLLETMHDIHLRFKCSFLRDVSRGLSFLHNLQPPMIHRDLTAKNVLVNSGLVCKLADLGTARIVPNEIFATMTQAPGTAIYMPPEALLAKTRYDTAIDLFSFGVLSIFTLSQQFPEEILSPNFYDHHQKLIARSELERRVQYMHMVYEYVGHDHPLVHMIESCLNNLPSARPKIERVMQIMEQAEAEPKGLMDMNKLELLTELQVKSEGTEILLREKVEERKREEERAQYQQLQIGLLETEIKRLENELAALKSPIQVCIKG